MVMSPDSQCIRLCHSRATPPQVPPRQRLLTLASRQGLAFSGTSISQPVSVVPSSIALATRCGAAHMIWQATIAAARAAQ